LCQGAATAVLQLLYSESTPPSGFFLKKKATFDKARKGMGIGEPLSGRALTHFAFSMDYCQWPG
jgi:hypothetical protein